MWYINMCCISCIFFASIVLMYTVHSLGMKVAHPLSEDLWIDLCRL